MSPLQRPILAPNLRAPLSIPPPPLRIDRIPLPQCPDSSPLFDPSMSSSALVDIHCQSKTVLSPAHQSRPSPSPSPSLPPHALLAPLHQIALPLFLRDHLPAQSHSCSTACLRARYTQSPQSLPPFQAQTLPQSSHPSLPTLVAGLHDLPHLRDNERTRVPLQLPRTAAYSYSIQPPSACSAAASLPIAYT
ncbi:uncharacterized protein SETTUDRAFT_40332 [Exserohilum turcica Et28A]|uniref:Uncharacterized protein n=1 Tax=Exserohilum turcicum (strain 28A) TaxID=671987 RepID=R0I528_EXST2|nr:uncharacterized protein SETTUDRAFT_40332 [Exserohilum turcica Et28A]EOA80666.1 hypothetical protein SETTUDRAFT_40332 [Exserohilum turcica Et28A]